MKDRDPLTAAGLNPARKFEEINPDDCERRIRETGPRLEDLSRRARQRITWRQRPGNAGSRNPFAR